MLLLGWGTGGSAAEPATAESGKTFQVCPGPTAQAELLTALFEAREGDTVELCAGEFSFDREIPIQDKRGITLAGAGKDQTFVRFGDSADAMGFSAVRTRGFTLRDMTVEDAPVVGVFILDSEQVTVRNVRVRWTGYDTCTPLPGVPDSCSEHGDVGIALDFSHDVLIEETEVYGATLVGLIALTASDAVLRGIRAERNVVGLFLDNTRRTLVIDGVVERNSIGIWVFDDRQHNPYGAKTAIRNTRIASNNTPNFAPTGNPLTGLPYGIGVLLTATDQVEIADNELADNGTTGLAVVNAALLNPSESETKYDFHPEGINVHDNLFRDNGGAPAVPDSRAGVAAIFVPAVLAKNGGKAAQVAWDGALDEPNDCEQVPTDDRGVPLNEPNPDDSRREPRTDERGRPNFQGSDPDPPCRWNAWKFDSEGSLEPENRIYIDQNRFEKTRPETLLVDDFVSFHITSSDGAQFFQDLLVPASNDLSPHAGVLASWPAPTPDLPYVVDPESENDRVTPEETAAVCAAVTAGAVNWPAVERHNCPLLSQYGLFADPEDPRTAPNGGMHYEINTPLFSDYAVKYRFLFVPPGKTARYADYAGDPSVTWDDEAQRALDLPFGTVIAKTFAFRTDDEEGNVVEEDVVETRLLIKRREYDRDVWVGMAYRWRDTPGGRIAELVPDGATAAVHFDYLDEDPEVLDGDGSPLRYAGSTDRYEIPSATRCASCHGGTDRDPGAAPISVKPRHLNREEPCEATGDVQNQLDCLVATGILESLPDEPANLERTPRWNVPGDAGEPAGSARDVHLRMRAYLETNCSYCHSDDGRAHITRMFLDSFRPVDRDFGICRPPLFAGRFGDRRFDIEPGRADLSVLHHRDTIGGALRMPPLARSLTNDQASKLMIDWIDRVLTDPSVDVDDAELCR